MIRLDKITKIYDAKVENKKALDEVSLTIDNGEIVAIMGPSGSGKSTLLNIIGCMDSVTDGSYYVDDIEVSRLNKLDIHRFRKKNIGFVFQHFALMDYYTAYENIELPLLANNIRRKDRKRIINEQLKKLNIVEEKDKYYVPTIDEFFVGFEFEFLYQEYTYPVKLKGEPTFKTEWKKAEYTSGAYK